jgi:hypothetical protein
MTPQTAKERLGVNTDLEVAVASVMCITNTQQFTDTVDLLKDVIDSNQNPGCGGDGSMSVEQWILLRDIERSLKQLRLDLLAVVRDTNPSINSDPRWVAENKRRNECDE